MCCGVMNQSRQLLPWAGRLTWDRIQKPHHHHSKQSVKAEDSIYHLHEHARMKNWLKKKLIWQIFFQENSPSFVQDKIQAENVLKNQRVNSRILPQRNCLGNHSVGISFFSYFATLLSAPSNKAKYTICYYIKRM